MELAVLFDNGQEQVYESIIAFEINGPHLCFQADDKSFHALERERILSVHFRLDDDQKGAVDIADVFN